MDHRPFEDWLLEDQPLTGDQKHQLNTHLKACPSCTALVEVNLALRSARLVDPEPGFTNRFQFRLSARKQALRRRNVWGFALLAASALAVLGWLTWPLVSGLISSPASLFASWVTGLMSFMISLQAIFQAGVVWFKVVPDLIPAYIWAAILVAAAGWSLLWVLSYIKINKVRQGV